MKMNEVRNMAKCFDIKTSGKKKTDIIKEIQRKEGNFDCYGSAFGDCDQSGCLFRASCLSEKQ